MTFHNVVWEYRKKGDDDHYLEVGVINRMFGMNDDGMFVFKNVQIVTDPRMESNTKLFFSKKKMELVVVPIAW